MKKIKRITFVLMVFVVFNAAYAVDKFSKIEKLTVEECNDVDTFVDTLEDPNLVTTVNASKQYHHTNARSCLLLKGLDTLLKNIAVGQVMCKKRVGGEYVEVALEEADVEHLTAGWDRPWNSDETYLKQIFNHERCPLDGHLYNPPAIEVDNE